MGLQEVALLVFVALDDQNNKIILVGLDGLVSESVGFMVSNVLGGVS